MIVYVHYFYDDKAQVEARKQFKRGRKKLKKGGGKVRGHSAPAGKGSRPRGLPEELAEFYRPIKKPVTLRLDADIIAWFRRQGRGYQTRINAALRKLMMAERKKAGQTAKSCSPV